MSYYFIKDGVWCHTLEYWKSFMKSNEIDQLELVKAKVDYGSGFFTCRYYETVGESGIYCGKQCEEYRPRNGKNGRCKHHGPTYEQTDEKLILFGSTTAQIISSTA